MDKENVKKTIRRASALRAFAR